MSQTRHVSGISQQGIQRKQVPVDHRAVMVDGLRSLAADIVAGRRAIRVQPALHLYRQQRGTKVHAYGEFLLQLGGRNCLRFVDEQWCMQPGDAVLLAGGIPHGETVEVGGGDFCHHVAMFDERRLSQHLGRAEPGQEPWIDGATLVISEHRRKPPVYRLLEELVALGEAGSGATGLQLALIGGLIDHLEREAGGEVAGDPQVRLAELQIAGRLGDPQLSVASLAALLDCHPDHLTRRFKAVHGRGVAAHIEQCRLAQAKELLAQGRLGIAELALACGYTRPAHFTHRFRQAEGCTPSVWRERHA